LSVKYTNSSNAETLKNRIEIKKLTTQDREKQIETKIRKKYYRLAEGPLLQQILVQRHAMIPTTTKISVVIKKPIPIR